MFITRESDYAVRVIRALAGEQRLSVSEICERESITAPFAYKIDPDLFIIECMDPSRQCLRDGEDGLPCLVHRELDSIQTELWNLLKRKTLQQIMDGE